MLTCSARNTHAILFDGSGVTGCRNGSFNLKLALVQLIILIPPHLHKALSWTIGRQRHLE